MDLATLKSDARFILQVDSTAYPDSEITRNLNRWYHIAQQEVMASMDIWTFSGNWAYTNLVSGQEQYPFPNDILSLQKAEVRYTSGGDDWVDVKNISVQQFQGQFSNSSDQYGQASPVYVLQDTSTMILRPIPDENITNGLRVYYTEETGELSDDADSPQLAEAYHRLLSYGAALDYIIANEILRKRNIVKAEINDLKENLRTFYSRRKQGSKGRIKPKMRNYA